MALVAACALTLALARPASAGDQFTLDSQADSFGPVVVDQSGDGYVAWLRKGGPSGDIDMFCKLAPSARSCAHPITLPVATYEESPTDTPFPVLGPGSEVFVVAPTYSSGQDVMWLSTNGGASFGTPYISPTNSQETPPSQWTDVCHFAPDLDDVIPFNGRGGQYDPSQGASPIEFEMTSSDPSATFSFDFYGGGCAIETKYVPITSGPGQIPYKWFDFSAPFVAQTTLGWAGGGSAACPRVAPGDAVEVYQTAGGVTPAIGMYRWSAPTGPCADTGQDLGTGYPGNWHGPSFVAHGEYPRLAGGKDGLFLLTAGYIFANGPTRIELQRYDVSTHSFAPATLVSRIFHPSSLEANSGGLGEDFSTGELAVAWPNVHGDDGLMNLFLSTNGGKRLSSAVPIGRLSSGFVDGDNVRVAVAPNGTGWVTWQDDGGLEVANLTPLPVFDARLKRHLSTISIPVICEAPAGKCLVRAAIWHDGDRIAHGRGTLLAGHSGVLRLAIRAPYKGLHAPLRVTLRLKITHPGIPGIRLVVHALVVR